MHYSIVHGIYTPVSEKLAKVSGALLPAAAVVFLALALGSVSIFQAAGQHPQLNTKTSGPVATTPKPVGPAKPTSSSTNSTASSGSAGSASLPPNASTSSAVPVATTAAGGYGGGATTPTTTSTTTTNPPSSTTTVTVPAQDISAGSKDLLSTSSLSLTVN